ncbi:MAG: plastocyanin/azurin family copper-binding protein [Gemmatimonadales bacterium]|nr:plastocyanin/azurin family copper-binding protein [Gemmatimonadales bacterium]
MLRKSLLVGLAAVLAACGGEKKAEEAPAAAPAPEAAAPAPAATGTTHKVEMVLDGGKYLYKPAELAIKAGDVVEFVNVSGGPHNVQFDAAKIPAGADKVLDAGMGEKMGPLAGALIAEPNASYKVSFANAPAGAYEYFCLPHQAMGMKGKITVQ